MAKMDVAYTADGGGRDIHYTVHVHTEALNWFSTGKLIEAMVAQFTSHLTAALRAMRTEEEEE